MKLSCLFLMCGLLFFGSLTFGEISSVDRDFGYAFILFVALLALICLLLILGWKKEREQDAKLAAQEKRLDAQEKRIEAQARELERIRKELIKIKQWITLKAEQLQREMHRDREVSPTGES